MENRWNVLTNIERKKTPEVIHPLIRTHPETGRKSIFISSAVTTGIKDIIGISKEESKTLLEELFEHIANPEFQVRYKWREGDLLIWDNRTLMHKATTDVLQQDRYRTLYRINTRGSVPY